MAVAVVLPRILAAQEVFEKKTVRFWYPRLEDASPDRSINSRLFSDRSAILRPPPPL